MNLGSRVKSLSFSFLLNIQMINTAFKKRKMYSAMAREKSTLIIFNEQITYGVPKERRKL